MKLLSTMMVAAFCLAAAGTAQAAFTHSSTQVFNTSADLNRKMVVKVDFGATAHTETFNITVQYTTTAGARWWVMDSDRMAAATTVAERNAAYLGWSFTTPGAAGGQTTTNYVTPSYSGIHTFVIEYMPQATAGVYPCTITVTLDNAAQAGVGSGTNSAVDNYLQMGIGQSGTSTGFVSHLHSAAHIEAVIGAVGDELMFNCNVDFGATPVALNVSLWGINMPNTVGTTGSGPLLADFYALSIGGGSTPQGSIVMQDVASPGNQAISAAYTTPALSGQQQFRVIVRGGTGFVANKLALVYLAIQTPGALPQMPQSPDTAIKPVTITPGGTNISANTQLTASGGSGTPSYVWSKQGTWPGSVTLSPLSGVNSTITIGTPAPAPGTQVTVRCANGTTGEYAEETFTIGSGTGTGVVNITTTSLPNGTVNVAYSASVAASGGTPPYTWSASGLPAGLSIDTNTGQITGTTAASGTFPVTITVTDSATPANTNVKVLNLTIGTGGGTPGGNPGSGFGSGGGGGGGGCVAQTGHAAWLLLILLMAGGFVARARRSN